MIIFEDNEDIKVTVQIIGTINQNSIESINDSFTEDEKTFSFKIKKIAFDFGLYTIDNIK